MASEKKNYINQTKSWVQEIVIGLNFCPFASKPFLNDTIKYVVIDKKESTDIMNTLAEECNALVVNSQIETSLLIIPDGYADFYSFLSLLAAANEKIVDLKLEGIIQIASFHPEYQFADSKYDDASNFTNRSPYPTMHLIREESLSKAIDSYPDVDEIPTNNIAKCNELGNQHFIDFLNKTLEK